MAQLACGSMFTVHQTVGTILCCKCGIQMHPNSTNMCANCLRSEVDITEGLQKHVIVVYCPKCDRYLKPPGTWIKAQLESKELLTYCLKRLTNLTKMVHLVNAEFIWTEPHSKRIKVRLHITKEDMDMGNARKLAQSYTVEYVVQDQMCESCTRFQANPDQWVAVVQLRQHVSHRRTFFYLEQLILKHDAAKHAVRIKQVQHGIDFFFGSQSHASKFVGFLNNVVPIKTGGGKQFVSHDRKSNDYNYKHAFSVEICPICREDLICLPPQVAVELGNFGPLVVCTKVSNSISLLDPLTLQKHFLSSNRYWSTPFGSLLSSRRLIEYIVLDMEVISSVVYIRGLKYALADAQVARVSDFGNNDMIFNVKTHLGLLLKPGDYALGYDLYGANYNNSEVDKHKGLLLPDVMLIKKSYEEKRQKRRGKPRAWKLKSLHMDADDSCKDRDYEDKMNTDYDEFRDDLEEDPELRSNMSLYHNKEWQQPSEITSMSDGDDLPSIPLDELLADLDLSDDDDHGDDDTMQE